MARGEKFMRIYLYLAPVALTTWIALLAMPTLSLASDPPPNIILILADDQGWTGTSVQMDPTIADSHSDYYQTPNLESLAAKGMRFSQAYASAPVCTPTRASIQTGKSPAQLQMTDIFIGPDIINSNRFQNQYMGLPLTPPIALGPMSNDHLTIAEYVKSSHPNYVTAHYGKWHLGDTPNTSATANGFDFSANRSGNPNVDPKSSFTLTTLTNNFMRDRVNGEDPFFVQLSHRAPHLPVEARPQTVQKYESLPPGARHDNPSYAAMVEDLDTGVGMVLQKVKDLGIEDNTYIIYYSDNGAPMAISTNDPFYWRKAAL